MLSTKGENDNGRISHEPRLQIGVPELISTYIYAFVLRSSSVSERRLRSSLTMLPFAWHPTTFNFGRLGMAAKGLMSLFQLSQRHSTISTSLMVDGSDANSSPCKELLPRMLKNVDCWLRDGNINMITWLAGCRSNQGLGLSKSHDESK